MFRKYLAVLIILFCIAGIGFARNCHQFFAQQQVVYQPYYQPQVYYAVGQDLQIEALVERKVQQIMAEKLRQPVQGKEQGKDWKQSLQQQDADLPAPAPPAPVPDDTTVPAPLAPAQNPNSALVQHCKKCHSGAKPKVGLVLDGLTKLKCSQITAALRALRDDLMPKDHAVDGAVKGQLMEELLALEVREPKPPVVQPPVPPVPPVPQGDLE